MFAKMLIYIFSLRLLKMETAIIYCVIGFLREYLQLSSPYILVYDGYCLKRGGGMWEGGGGGFQCTFLYDIFRNDILVVKMYF